MSEQERNEIIGGVISECKQKTQDLEIHKAKAAQIGKELIRLGKLLENTPEHLMFWGGEPVPFPELGMIQCNPFKKSVLDSTAIDDLAKEIRRLTSEVEQLEARKRALGL